MLSNGFHDIPAGKMAVVVTHLEMASRAGLRPEPQIDGAVIRRVMQPDLDWYRDLFTRVGATEWLWSSRLKLDNTALAGILNDAGYHIYAMQFKGRDEGLLELDFRSRPDCSLAFFGATRALIGTGAGRVLMNHAITAAWAKPITRLILNTCTGDHPAALAFYRRSGFVPVRQQIEISDDPRLTGVLPRDSGPNIPVFK